MAHSNDYVVAIDLGTTKVVTMVGKMNSNGKLQVVGLSTAESTGIKRGMIQNIEETVKAIQKTVDDVKKQVGLEFHSAYVGIAGQHIRSIKNSNYLNFDTDDREISQDDIDRLVKDMNLTPVDAGETILHVLPLEFFVDKEPVDNNRPVGMMGRRLDANFHIVIGKTSSAKHIEKCVNRVGLSVADLILEPLASAEAVLTDDEREAGVALIDIGGGTTDLAIYYEGNIRHTAVIPFGGNVITQDIKEGCSILLKQADQLKEIYGIALSDIAPDNKIITIPGISGREPKEISVKNLAGIIQARMEEILDFVLYEINLSGYAEKLSAGVVITGGGALLKHLSHLIKFKSGYDVRLGFPSEKLSSDSLEKYNHPQLSTALGLALIGLERQTATPVQDDAKQQNATEPSVDKEFSEVHEKKGSKFNAIKQMISGLFEETDSEM
ncbi:MAG TPA: cell division protein FtsA [Tenuifilaceae bacterium]|jgi:cell division protein FtsA|nr:cell division protein FtsA [Bacteroidales bacterium]HNY08454.1 cell division protein FtsA [Tenuifilaceae bacterium]MBP8643876.1 cell division protein FtsA [Bacteroidales bacterium]HOW20884.1 cell division protein FtsA [Tenuifilaceae bacterium]HQQ29985.1 cell division protein FtsA [Tenuifilaceae bacterium]